ncbi:hypothetical protein QE152_g15999 [Popillia japonica]|uniref:Uncharacterized protein n=1 Tax=Popillia japonica TaxID=7064 RepID=A0AAW1L694_POPJA
MDESYEEMSYDCAPEDDEEEEWASSDQDVGKDSVNIDYSIDEESDHDEGNDANNLRNTVLFEILWVENGIPRPEFPFTGNSGGQISPNANS